MKLLFTSIEVHENEQPHLHKQHFVVVFEINNLLVRAWEKEIECESKFVARVQEREGKCSFSFSIKIKMKVFAFHEKNISDARF